MQPNVIEPNSNPSSASPEPSTPPLPPPPEQPTVLPPPPAQSAPSVTQSPLPQTSPAFMQPSTPMPPESAKTGRIHRWLSNPKTIFMVPIALVLLIGGGAAAYFGYIVPNQPQTKLVSALANALNEDKGTIEGSLEGQFKDSGENIGYNIAYTFAADEKNALVKADIGVAGAKFPAEMRIVDDNLFFKIGGLASVSSLPGLADDPTAQQFLPILEGIDDQWYEIDKSALATGESADANCTDAFNVKLNDNDKKILKKAFKQSPPLVIKSTAKTEVEGQKVTKYEVTTADGKTLRDFVDGIAGVSLMENLNKCDPTGNSSPEALRNQINESLTPSRPFNIYVDKNQKLKRIDFDYTNEEGSLKFVANFKWEATPVTKPEGAKPIQELLEGVLGEVFLNTYSGVQSKAKDTERKTDIGALYSKLEEYYALNGRYPTFDQFNNPTWRKDNMKGLDDEALKDPDGTAATLSAQPDLYAYSYTAYPEGCGGQDDDCLDYTLTATLDEGGTYVKNSINYEDPSSLQ